VISTKHRYNLGRHTSRTVVKVPPKMVKVNFWLSIMKPARKETTFRVQIMVSDINWHTLERLVMHRGDDEGGSCPPVHQILGIEILRFVSGSFATSY